MLLPDTESELCLAILIQEGRHGTVTHRGLNVFAKVLRDFKERIGSLHSKGYHECLLQQEPHYEKSKNNHTFKWKNKEEILDEKICKLYLINLS